MSRDVNADRIGSSLRALRHVTSNMRLLKNVSPASQHNLSYDVKIYLEKFSKILEKLFGDE